MFGKKRKQQDKPSQQNNNFSVSSNTDSPEFYDNNITSPNEYTDAIAFNGNNGGSTSTLEDDYYYEDVNMSKRDLKKAKKLQLKAKSNEPPTEESIRYARKVAIKNSVLFVVIIALSFGLFVFDRMSVKRTRDLCQQQQVSANKMVQDYMAANGLNVPPTYIDDIPSFTMPKCPKGEYYWDPIQCKLLCTEHGDLSDTSTGRTAELESSETTIIQQEGNQKPSSSDLGALF